MNKDNMRLIEVGDDMERIKRDIRQYSNIIERFRKRYTELQREYNALIIKISEED